MATASVALKPREDHRKQTELEEARKAGLVPAAVASSLKLRAKGSGWWLPFELVEEILGRTQIEDLLRAKSICKEWYGLIKSSKRFINKHLELSQDKNEKRFIRIYPDMVQIMNPVTLDLLCLPIPTEFATMYKKHAAILSVIHCDGLLLCRCDEGNNSKRTLAVWNPVMSSNRVKWIEPLHSYHFLDAYGFGYDKNTYKILRFYVLGECEIYDFNSKLWRVLPAAFNWKILLPCQNVSMKGNMYWIAQTMSNPETTFIQSFDFSKETFKPMCYSFPVEVGYDQDRGISLNPLVLSDFGGDRLSLLHQHHVGDGEIKIEVWVTNKVTDDVVSWSKYFNVTQPHLPVLPLHHVFHGNPTYFIHKTNGIMLWCDIVVQQEDQDVEEEACVSFYEIGNGEVEKQVETGPRYEGKDSTCICGHLYVPSLVPVPE